MKKISINIIKRIVCIAGILFPVLAYAGFTSSTQPGAAFDVVTGVPTWPTGNSDDGAEVVNIGFTFDFQGTSYTQVRLITNGALHFGADQNFHNQFTNTTLAAGTADRLIMPFWDDLDPGAGGTVTYGTLGTAPNRRFVAHWNQVERWNNAAATCSFQVVLFEGSNDIHFRYDPTDTGTNCDGRSATVGAEEDDTNFDEFSFNTALNLNNDIIYTQTVTSGLVVTMSGVVKVITAGAVSFNGAEAGSPEANATNSNTGSNTITTNISTLTNNAFLMDVVGADRTGSFSPGASQTEQWDLSPGGFDSTGAGSTRQVATAGATSMAQTFSIVPNKLAHAVAAIAPASGSSISIDSSSSNTATFSNTSSWNHAVTSDPNAKLVVGIAVEEGFGGGCGGDQNVSSVTYNGVPLSFINGVTITTGGICERVELWYLDLRNIIVSTNNNSVLGGQAMDQDEAVEYDAFTNNGTLFFDDATFNANERLTGLHLYSNGNVALATASDANIGGNAFQDDDIVEVTPSGTAGLFNFVQVIFDGATHFTAADERIDAVYIRENNNIILSTVGSAQLPRCGGGNLNFNDDDLVEWDPTNTCATMFLDESTTGNLIPNSAGDEDIVGVHLLNDDSNLILFSLVRNNTIRGTAVLDGDVVLYNRTADTATVYFSESNFTSGGEDIDALTLDRPIVNPSTVDHYAISYPLGTPGVTCEALAVRITAHGDATDHTILVAPSNTTTITLSTSPAADGWTLKTGAGTFTPPNQYTFDGSETFAEFWLTETTATSAPHIDIDVTDGSATDIDGDATEDANIEFADAVFRFFDGGGTGESIETQIAGKESDIVPNNETLQLRSVVTNSTTMACESRILNLQTIEMAYKCNNPTTCESTPTATRVQVENAATTTFDITPGNNNADTVDESNGNFDNVDLDFGATGTATFSFDFNDAGQIQLYARKTIAASPPDPAYTIFGISNQFVVKPAGLCVESSDTDSDCVSANGSCTKFKKAGSVDAENFFNLTVRGVTWETAGESNTDFCSGSNVTTPNFQLSTISFGTTATAVGDTANNGTLAVTSIDITANGTATESSQAISEVGAFTITAIPPSYLGETIAASTSANIGRFYPDRFNVIMNNTPAFADSCSGFTYIDQPFYYSTAPQLQITALNSNGITTSNYGGSFWKLTGSLLNRDYSDGSAVAPNASFFPNTTVTGGVSLAGDTDFDGIGTLSLTAGNSGDELMYQKGMPESAFDADVDVTFLAAAFQDTDHTVSSPVCYDITNDGTCDDLTHPTMQGTELRWGRMVLSNAFGSELLSIEVPITVEYFGTDDFEVNTLDTCTTYDSADMSFSNEDGVTLGNLSLTGSGTMVSGKDDPANSILATSTANEIGSADVTIDLTAQDWLQFDWDNDTNYDNDPTSRITWGIFSGSDEFIYIREPW